MLALGMLRLKACPRCNGDVVFERDNWGWYEQCIQCGYLRDLQNELEVKQQQPQDEESWVGRR
jgi:ssDNA-binding Zn-finger/Zn-ribbon topoisomerase 1